MGESVFMDKQNAFNTSPHPNLVELVPHSLKSSWNGWIPFIQWIFCSKCIVSQWISKVKQHKHKLIVYEIISTLLTD